ncbi:hypothetical protein AAG570_010069 [Ranatra chinensis]|uniref:Tetraspanin n=1 Tax=Ranatra chinensis TaxID=642074 RepID=A0ABD0YLW5_9HEMI
MESKRRNMFYENKKQETTEIGHTITKGWQIARTYSRCTVITRSRSKLKLASKRGNVFYQNMKQETTEIEQETTVNVPIVRTDVGTGGPYWCRRFKSAGDPVEASRLWTVCRRQAPGDMADEIYTNSQRGWLENQRNSLKRLVNTRKISDSELKSFVSSFAVRRIYGENTQNLGGDDENGARFTCLGVAVIAIGVLTRSLGDKVTNVVENGGVHVSAPSIALIVIGVIVFIIAFFGCCGAIRESSCMMTTYAVFLLVILVIEIAIGIIVIVFVKDIRKPMKESMEKLFDDYSKDTDAKEAVDSIQRDLHCCGADRTTYWGPQVPPSCCRDAHKDDKGGYVTCETWDVDCSKAVTQLVQKWGRALGGIAIGVACVELLGVILALCLASSIRRNERRGYV